MFGLKRKMNATSPRRKKPSIARRNSISTPSVKLNAATPASNINVVLRVRPPDKTELEERYRDVVEVVDENFVIFDPKEEEDPFFVRGKRQAHRDITKKMRKHLQFGFDKVFGPEASTPEVYQKTIQSLIASLLNGYNCSVFAYGATGSGKTYTMLGKPENPGITPQLMCELYSTLETLENTEVDVMVSYLEIYNEMVRDLLQDQAKVKLLQLREDGNNVLVSELSWHRPSTADDLMAMLQTGNERRTQHPTDANSESSRSHAVFQVMVKMKRRAVSGRQGQVVRCAKLSMIDLAGSERAAATRNNRTRFTEGANINKSLLALGNCINALADSLKHVPFRNSKLTRLLKGSLGGNCQTVMIANVSPSSLSYEDTYNTLKYATRAKKIKTRAKKNQMAVDFSTADLTKSLEEKEAIIHLLRTENAQLKAQISALMTVKDNSASSPSLRPSPSPIVVAAGLTTESSPQVSVVNLTQVQPLQELQPPTPATVGQLAESLRPLLEILDGYAHLKKDRCEIEAKIEQLEARLQEKKSKLVRLTTLFQNDVRAKEEALEHKLGAQIDNLKQRMETVLQAEVAARKSCLQAGEAIENQLVVQMGQPSVDVEVLLSLLRPLLDAKCELSEERVRKLQAQRLLKNKTTDMNDLHSTFCVTANMLRQYQLRLRGLDLYPPDMQHAYEELGPLIRGQGSVTWRDESKAQTLEQERGAHQMPELMEHAAITDTTFCLGNATFNVEQLKENTAPQPEMQKLADVAPKIAPKMEIPRLLTTPARLSVKPTSIRGGRGKRWTPIRNNNRFKIPSASKRPNLGQIGSKEQWG